MNIPLPYQRNNYNLKSKLRFNNLSSLNNSNSFSNINHYNTNNNNNSNLTEQNNGLISNGILLEKSKKLQIYPKIFLKKNNNNNFFNTENFITPQTQRKILSCNSLTNLNNEIFKYKNKLSSSSSKNILETENIMYNKLRKYEKENMYNSNNNNIKSLYQKRKLSEPIGDEELLLNNKINNNKKNLKLLINLNKENKDNNNSISTTMNTKTINKIEEIDTPEELHFMQIQLCKKIKKLNKKFDKVC